MSGRRGEAPRQDVRTVAETAIAGPEVPPRGEMVLYEAADGGPAVEVRLERDTVWLSQAQMVELFERDQSVVSRHLRNVFAEGELDGSSNMQKTHIAGSAKPVALYSLDVIISVGYRVKSKRSTQFRIWATRVLRDHLTKGYTVNARRLKELVSDTARSQGMSRTRAILAECINLQGRSHGAYLP